MKDGIAAVIVMMMSSQHKMLAFRKSKEVVIIETKQSNVVPTSLSIHSLPHLH
jgi:hypothetical protein